MFTPGLVVAVHSLLWHVAVTTIRTDNYVRITLCGISQLTSLTLSAEPGLTTPVRPVLCADLCSRRLDCVGFSIESQTSCFTLTIWPNSTDTCTVEDQTFNTYLRTKSPPTSCLNGGVWDSAKDSCVCSGGRVGVYCERYATTCTELKLFGYPRGTRLPVKLQPPTFSAPFLVSCVLRPTYSRLHLATTTNEDLSFNRTWGEYKSGFYAETDEDIDEDIEYWIGLEKIHYFTAKLGLDHLYVVADILEKTHLRSQYLGFVVDDEASSFQASYTRFISNINSKASYVSGDLDPCFEPDTKIPFSTPDTDNDGDPSTNCANQSGAGWWFRSGCLTTTESCNPFGTFYQQTTERITNMHIRLPGLDMQSLATDLHEIKLYLVDKF